MGTRRERRQVIAYRPIQPDPQRVADKRVADRRFIEMRQRSKEHEVVEIEVVARVDTEPLRVRGLRGRGVRGETLAAGGVAALEGARERLRVELDAIGADLARPRGRRCDGIDEDADARAVGQISLKKSSA